MTEHTIADFPVGQRVIRTAVPIPEHLTRMFDVPKGTCGAVILGGFLWEVLDVGVLFDNGARMGWGGAWGDMWPLACIAPICTSQPYEGGIECGRELPCAVHDMPVAPANTHAQREVFSPCSRCGRAKPESEWCDCCPGSRYARLLWEAREAQVAKDAEPRRPYQRERILTTGLVTTFRWGAEEVRDFGDGSRPYSMIDRDARAILTRGLAARNGVPDTCPTPHCIGTIRLVAYSTGFEARCGSCGRDYK